MIKLYDVSALLYMGNSVERPGDDFISENLNGLPVRGLRYALEQIIAGRTENDYTICVMDNKTNKGEFFEGYKSNRTFNNEVFFQRELLRYLIPNLGLPMLSQKQFEADYLFYCFIIDKFLTKSIPSDGISLYCDDLDLVGCLIDKHIIRYGLKANTPMISVDNYPFILHRQGYDIPYNAVLPFILFNGKKSNNLSPIKTEKGRDCFTSFMRFAKEKYAGKDNLYSLQNLMNAWLVSCQEQGLYSDNFYNEINSRMPVVYPRLNWDKSSALVTKKLDKKVALNFLTLLQEPKLIRILGMTPIPEETVDKHLLDKWVSIYRSGTTFVDNYVTADSTFFFEESDSSGNIGGF